MTVSVRRATPEDLPGMAKRAARLVELHHDWDQARFILPRGVEEGYRGWFGRELRDQDAVLLVGILEGAIVGYLYGRIEAHDWNMLLDRHGALHDIYVDETARGHHVGEALIETFMDALRERGVPRAVLHTASANTKAHGMFERVGFRRTMIEMTCEVPSK